MKPPNELKFAFKIIYLLSMAVQGLLSTSSITRSLIVDVNQNITYIISKTRRHSVVVFGVNGGNSHFQIVISKITVETVDNKPEESQ